MAALGTLTGKRLSAARHIPVTSWQQYRTPTCKSVTHARSGKFDYAGDISAALTGVLAGTVFSGALPVPNCNVVIFSRKTKLLVFSTTTDIYGAFSIPAVAEGSTNSLFFAVALPPNGADYNAVIFDSVLPV